MFSQLCAAPHNREKVQYFIKQLKILSVAYAIESSAAFSDR